MFKEWLKQFTCVLLCLITLLSPISEAYAKDYVESDSSGGCSYYIVEGKDVKKLFDFSISDVPNILDWILDFKTYTVIKDYTDSDGNNVKKGYFNTPNLQSIVKNSVISKISDGYTDDTYDVNETEKIVLVGENADSENAITKYGFNIPSYTYMGEYPKEVMSPAGIVPSPKSWWEMLWRAIKALFGVSFLKAPDADNFNSIRYINHTYTDRADYVLEFMKKYYLQWFESQLVVHRAWDTTAEDTDDWDKKAYFESPEDLMALTVTEDAADEAEAYCDKYDSEYKSALQHYIWWYKYKSNGFSTKGLADGSWFDSFKSSLPDATLYDAEGDAIDDWTNKWDKIDDSNVYMLKDIYGLEHGHVNDGWHYLASRFNYKNKFYNWLSSNLSDAYVIVNSIPDDVVRHAYMKDSSSDFASMISEISDVDVETVFTNADSYGLDPSTGSFDKGTEDSMLISLAADMVRYSYDYIMTHIEYYNQERKEHRDLNSTKTTKEGKTYFKYRVIPKKSDGSDGTPYELDFTASSYRLASSEWSAYLSSFSEDGPDWGAAEDVSYWESGSYDGATDGDWHNSTADPVHEDRYYKDVASWISNPSIHTEPSDSADTEDTGTPVEGSPYGAPKEDEQYFYPNPITGNIVYTNDHGDIIHEVDFGVDWSNTNRIEFIEVKSWVEVTKTDYTRLDTRTHYRKADFKFDALWDGRGDYNDTTYKITTLTDYTNDFLKQLDFNHYDVDYPDKNGNIIDFKEDDFVHPDLQAIYKNYEKNIILCANFKIFNRYMARGTYMDEPEDDPDIDNLKSTDLDDLEQIPYRQCMIYNTGEEGECKSQKFGDEDTTITVANVVVYSGVYKITEKYRSRDYVDDSGNPLTLTDEDAHAILQQLQIYCGPYYDDVLANMFKLMAAAAENEGDDGPTTRIVDDDTRTMPYDTGSMVRADKENYDVIDPRVSIYKDHIIGGVISDFTLNGGIGIFIKPQKTIINIAGRITELSVFLQSVCNFDFLDSLGLSPATMWNSVFTTLLMVALVLYFIIKTAVAAIKMGSRGTGKVIIAFLILALELGVVTCFAANPDGTWTKLKNINKKVMNLGEIVTVYGNDNLQYLFGDAESYEVAYYIPYLDCWSKFNTGYGILEDEQLIDSTKDYRELDDFYNPQIAGSDIQHWSVLLMDSFEYHGRNNAVINTVQYDGHTVNGSNINSNAYRVVDHFMAPRVTFGTSGDNLTLSTAENENYNGEFQTGFGDILVKLANCCLCCFLSIIKLMIFIFFWWQLYVFIFNVVLGLGAERKKFSEIVIETFTPLLALVLFGTYSGICMNVGMTMEGFIGFCVIFFMFWLTCRIIIWWHDAARGKKFPFTLGWLYLLLSMSRTNRVRQQEELENQSRLDAMDADIDFTEEENTDFTKKTSKLFDESGNIRPEYAQRFKNDEKVQKVYDNWYKHSQYKKQNYGYVFTSEERAAVKNYENNTVSKDRAAKIRDEITLGKKITTPKKKLDKIKVNDDDDKEDAKHED